MKRLAERITQGPIERCNRCSVHEDAPSHRLICCTNDEDVEIYFADECEANAELIAEAFNVTHETGKTPRELADELKAANKLIKDVQLMVQYHAKRELIVEKIKNFRKTS